MAVIPRQWIAPFELAFSLLKDWGKPRSNEPLNPFAASAAPGPELPGAVNLPTEVDFTTHADERLAQEGRVHSDEEEEEIRQRVQQMAEQHKLFDQQKLLQNIKRVGIITHEIPKGDSRHNTDGNRILTIMSPKQKKQIGHPLDGKLIPTVKTTFPIYHNPRHPKRIWDIAQNKGLTHIIDMTGTHPLQQNKLHKVMGGGKRLKGEPMDLAWRLLKNDEVPFRDDWSGHEEYHPGEGNEERDADYFRDMPEHSLAPPQVKRERVKIGEEAMKPPFPPTMPINLVMQSQPNYEGAPPEEDEPTNRGIKFSGDFTTGEPMDLAFRLLKDRKSPEAFANKKKYDTKYHNNPKRREYRAELARERRKRNVMGNGGKDMSHAKNGKIVSEDADKNRARHFKDRGTLK